MNIIERILACRVRVIFKPLPKGIVGMTAHGSHIEIDLFAINPVKVYFHEVIHFIEPSWSETRVTKVERSEWQKTTRDQRFLLGRKLYRWGEP